MRRIAEYIGYAFTLKFYLDFLSELYRAWALRGMWEYNYILSAGLSIGLAIIILTFTRKYLAR